MKSIITIGLLIVISSCSIKNENPSVKSILLGQLKNSHTNKDWYVPINIAVQSLTTEQANWRDSTDNHSIGQLVSHLIFWNERNLIGFHGSKPPDFNGDNDATFKILDEDSWEKSIRKIDSVQTAWEQAVENATDEQLKQWSISIANISSHNAYHTGQIVYIRKQNGWWDAEKGVK